MTAQNAIFHLGRLGVPKGTFCFGNVEHFFEVDEASIRGWVESKEQDAPTFHPQAPACTANVWAWQYGKDAFVLWIRI